MILLLITREADYALRILRTLSEGGLVTAAEITQRELIPRQFAYKILRKLSQVGIIAVNRGVEGGCRLTADLREKSLYDLMAALNLVELVNACMAPGYQCSWRQSCGRDCKIHSRLAAIQQSLDQELRRHSLAAILSGE